jgi:hypothetical protein
MSNKHIVLVLDIDSTLVHTQENRNIVDILLTDYKNSVNPYVYNIRRNAYQLKFNGHNDMSGFYRPYLKDFMIKAHKICDKVCFWSAGEYSYVHKMIKKIYDHTGIIQKPNVIWTRNDCVFNVDNMLIKPLENFTNKNGFQLKNTVILDDTEITFGQNRDNAVHIPRFQIDKIDFKSIKNVLDTDKALLNMINALDQLDVHLKRGGSVQTFNKDDIFDYNLLYQ